MATDGICTVLDNAANEQQQELLPNSSNSRYRSNNNDTTIHVDESNVNFKQFLRDFFTAKAVPQLLLVASLLGFGIGSVVGLIPATLANRYAHLYHFDVWDEYKVDNCMNYTSALKPVACQRGSDDAQAAASWSNLMMNVMTLTFSPVIGALSDDIGRRPFLLLGLFLSCIPSAMYYIVLTVDTMSPFWYYASYSCIGIVNFTGLNFASLSDIIAPKHRTAAYGMLLASFFGSFSLAPVLAYAIGDPIHVAIFSLGMSVASFLVAALFLPETKKNFNETQQSNDSGNNLRNRCFRSSSNSSSWIQRMFFTVSRPIREMTILNRNWILQRIALGVFVSSMVHASDVTLIVYYVEAYLKVQQKDIASMFFLLGLAGIIIQTSLNPITRILGEKGLLVLSFCCGTLHNCLYGVASSKYIIYVAFIVSQLTKTNIPILSSVASKHVSCAEQGRIQGALFAIGAIANAIGPILMQLLYHETKTIYPGLMFICASLTYLVGTVIVSTIPITKHENGDDEEVESIEAPQDADDNDVANMLEQPLLEAER